MTTEAEISTTTSLLTSRHQNATHSMTTTNASVLENVTTATYLTTTDGSGFFGHLDLRDETTFVALIVMGVFVPAIFITMFVLIFLKRRKQVKERKAVMLLRNAQDMALDDYTCTIR